ncbi:hypothetical protein ElyMa_001109600 [Elysia marginata]|uniref:Uncharacterized protein n=1 Tax=Elysia marginata TaxID=1093978 RepID=A0AAV4HVY5_9GAST|nr:hypothetical protein ElyMa_001109600 [Elysia marginata]
MEAVNPSIMDIDTPYCMGGGDADVSVAVRFLFHLLFLSSLVDDDDDDDDNNDDDDGDDDDDDDDDDNDYYNDYYDDDDADDDDNEVDVDKTKCLFICLLSFTKFTRYECSKQLRKLYFFKFINNS